MNSSYLRADLRVASQLERLSDWVQAWDHDFSLTRPPAEAILYEPDATMYGIALTGPLTIRLNHRVRVLQSGDLIVVPAGLALDCEPMVDLLSVCCAGQSPDHFRERFIQVWGYDHFPRVRDSSQTSWQRIDEILPATDLRYRLSYSAGIIASERGSITIPVSHLDLTIVIVIEGEFNAAIGQIEPKVRLNATSAVAVEPGLEVVLEGSGTVGVLRLVNEPAFHARRHLAAADPKSKPSPEAGPRPYNPPDHQAAAGEPGLTNDVLK